LHWRSARCAGGPERSQLELRDYRDLQGTYDAVVSIEMFEAVGERTGRVFRSAQPRLRPADRP
jgi:cyclopropane-fatty-acyl-phospholipid synthase